MKTSDEIKKGLECCSDVDGFDRDCIKCPYKDEHRSHPLYAAAGCAEGGRMNYD